MKNQFRGNCVRDLCRIWGCKVSELHPHARQCLFDNAECGGKFYNDEMLVAPKAKRKRPQALQSMFTVNRVANFMRGVIEFLVRLEQWRFTGAKKRHTKTI
jgi:hypothetical protein